MSGGGGNQTTTTQSDALIRPHQAGSLNYSNQIINQNPSGVPVYGGAYAPQTNQYQMDALQRTAQRAYQGSDLTRAAQGELQNTLEGDYLGQGVSRNNAQITAGSNPYSGSNPYLQGIIDSTSRDITDNYSRGTAAQTDMMAARANALGSSGYNEQVQANQRGLGRTLSDATTGIRMQDYGMQQQLAESGLNRDLQAQNAQAQIGDANAAREQDAYQRERARQMQGMLFAPQMAEADYADAQRLGAAGNTQYGLEQSQIDAQRSRFEDQQLAPYRQSEWYANQIARLQGGVGQTSQMTGARPATSPYMGALGGAASGAVVGTQISPGYGTAIGAGVGGLMGYLGSR